MDEETSYPYTFHTPLQALIQSLHSALHTQNKDQLKDSLYEIYKLIAQNHPRITQQQTLATEQITKITALPFTSQLLELILQSAEKFHQHMDVLKGLVTLCNLLLHLEPAQTQKLAARPQLLKKLTNFFAQLEDSESLFQTLALIAQVLNTSAHEAAAEEQKSSTCESTPDWLSKQFVYKIINFDLDELDCEKKRNSAVSMLAIVAISLTKARKILREYRITGQFKTFLLQLLKECKDQKSLGQTLYSLCQLLNEVKFTEKETLKHRTVEILIQNIAPNKPKVIIFGTIRMLKTLWRANIRRSAMIKQELVKKLIDVYTIQPTIVLAFAEEILASEGQKLLEEKTFINLLLEVLRNEEQERLKLISSAISTQLGGATAQQIFGMLGQGLINFLQPQLGKSHCEIKLKSAVLEYFSQLLSYSQVTPSNERVNSAAPVLAKGTDSLLHPISSKGSQSVVNSSFSSIKLSIHPNQTLQIVKSL